jgi:hexosaminidase
VKNKLTILFLFCVAFVSAQNSETILPLIPQPDYVQTAPGTFSISDSTIMVASETSPEALYLKEYLKKNYNINLTIAPHYPPFRDFIVLLLSVPDGGEYDKESYQLKITKKGVTINAHDFSGLFYGIQTLIQLLPVNGTGSLSVPCVQVYDSPRYKWRGMHLDCSRHFFTKEEVKKYIDYMALYKFNTFHWHLTDDQGWRIEIKKYPLLTQIGSQRKETIIGKPVDAKGKPLKNIKYDGKAYGGFYSQEDVKEIIAYATQRHITIVPEIEMPGHSLAALAAYPQFSCIGGHFETATTWGVFDDVYCAGNDSTFDFMENILSEVCDLFPGQYIHIGGDECPKARWEKCPKCQKRMKDENLKDEMALQSYFITRIEKFVNSKGKQIIGWDEILEGGLAPNAAVMSWRGTDGGIAAARQKHNVVMTPGKPCYFEHYQSKDKDKEPLAIGGYNPLDSVYNYEPTPKMLASDEKERIMGAQGNVWTEYIPDFSHVEYMSVPRMCALAETLWTKPEHKDYKNFILRLKAHSKLLDRMNVNYAKQFTTLN